MKTRIRLLTMHLFIWLLVCGTTPVHAELSRTAVEESVQVKLHSWISMQLQNRLNGAFIDKGVWFNNVFFETKDDQARLRVRGTVDLASFTNEKDVRNQLSRVASWLKNPKVRGARGALDDFDIDTDLDMDFRGGERGEIKVASFEDGKLKLEQNLNKFIGKIMEPDSERIPRPSRKDKEMTISVEGNFGLTGVMLTDDNNKALVAGTITKVEGNILPVNLVIIINSFSGTELGNRLIPLESGFVTKGFSVEFPGVDWTDIAGLTIRGQ